jgi:hypothetical protein
MPLRIRATSPVYCGKCGKRRGLIHTCIIRRPNGRTRLKAPKVMLVSCPNCGKPYANPFTHVCASLILAIVVIIAVIARPAERAADAVGRVMVDALEVAAITVASIAGLAAIAGIAYVARLAVRRYARSQHAIPRRASMVLRASHGSQRDGPARSRRPGRPCTSLSFGQRQVGP